jgi:hypothetical protein
MARVFEHNLWDILSLVALACEVETLVRAPRSPLDQWALARVCMKGRVHARALELLEAACDGLPPGPESVDAHLMLARRLKAVKDTGRLKACLDRVLEQDPENTEVLTELAKFNEHVSRDMNKALLYARQSLWLLEEEGGKGSSGARRIEQARRRIRRLQRKTGEL